MGRGPGPSNYDIRARDKTLTLTAGETILRNNTGRRLLSGEGPSL